MNDRYFSSLAICHQNIYHQKGDGISTITFYKPTYSSYSIGVALIYMRQLSVVSTFCSKLEFPNNSQEISIILQDFDLNALDSEGFAQITNTLSKFNPFSTKSTYLNSSLIDQVSIRKTF